MQTSGERIFITGASGFVGRHVLRAFRDVFASAEILGAGRRALSDVPDGVVYEALDLVDPAAVTRRVHTFRPTQVLHLAAEASVVRADASKFDTWRINFGALYNLIDAVERTGEACTFAFVSSGEVYCRAFLEACPVTERTLPQPMSAYARSKCLGEQLLLKSVEGICLKPLVLRPFNHIGPGQNVAFAVASFAHQIALIERRRHPPVVEAGNLSVQRDFLDVADVVAAFVKVFQAAGRLDGPRIFNICSGQPRSVESMLAGLRGLSHVPFDIRPDPLIMRQADVLLAFGDARQLQRATGWAPRIDAMTSLAGILEDARMQVAGAET